MTTQSQNEITGYSHPKCYANKYNDCSKKISKEHCVSRAMLKQLSQDNVVSMWGPKWIEKSTIKDIPINTLSSFVLCERHNNLLSEIDNQMVQFTQAIIDFNDDLSVYTKDASSKQKTFSGIAIEKWMLKCLIGYYHSKCEEELLKSECLDVLFGVKKMPIDWGLYFGNIQGTTLYYSESICVETLSNKAKNKIEYFLFNFRGLPFCLVMCEPVSKKNLGTWRPCAIHLLLIETRRTIHFNWQGESHGVDVTLNRSNKHSGSSPYLLHKMKGLRRKRK